MSQPIPSVRLPLAVLAASVLGACAYTGDTQNEADRLPPESPVPGAVLRNELLEPEERHFKNLWQLTFGGQNAEAYWNYADDALSLQVTKRPGWECDRIFITGADGDLRQVSNGLGVTTCSFFMPNDEEVLYASTQSMDASCPDFERKKGEPYTWPIWPNYDIYVASLSDGSERPLIQGYGYDAEATVSPIGDRIVFTSTRSGDLELWTSNLEGGDLQQVTDVLGYDGGAFFSHDGETIVFRATSWTEGNEAAEMASYREEYQRWRVKPNDMEIFTIRPDGSMRTQVTHLGDANFAPYFTPDDQKIIFATNHHSEETAGGFKLNFDLFLCDLNGENLERITFFDDGPAKQFDSFPMFSHDGRFLAFSSNRGGKVPGETNVFIAEWSDTPLPLPEDEEGAEPEAPGD